MQRIGLSVQRCSIWEGIGGAGAGLGGEGVGGEVLERRGTRGLPTIYNGNRLPEKIFTLENEWKEKEFL